MEASSGTSDLIGRAQGGRKLIAIVHADVVGYSRLIGLDDAGTIRLGGSSSAIRPAKIRLGKLDLHRVTPSDERSRKPRSHSERP